MSTQKFAKTKRRRRKDQREGIVERLRALRVARFGPRGQSHLCRLLGVTPSTYHYYEKGRVPPADLLVRVADATHANLLWLLTGQGAMDATPPAGDSLPATPAAGIAASPSLEIRGRIDRLLARSPQSGRALAAFVELLERVETVQRQRPGSSDRVAAGSAVRRVGRKQDDPVISRIGPVIPVLGRTAASLPQFWASTAEAAGLVNQMAWALESLAAGQRVAVTPLPLQGQKMPRGAVALVQLTEPVALADLSVHEVLESPRLAECWPGAFALRVDGDSMRPMLEPDDLVVLSPKAVALDGQPAVVQLANQVGVTCKIYRRARGQVRLISANEAYPTSVHRSQEVVWALRVLARVRPGGG